MMRSIPKKFVWLKKTKKKTDKHKITIPKVKCGIGNIMLYDCFAPKLGHKPKVSIQTNNRMVGYYRND